MIGWDSVSLVVLLIVAYLTRCRNKQAGFLLFFIIASLFAHAGYIVFSYLRNNEGTGAYEVP